MVDLSSSNDVTVARFTTPSHADVASAKLAALVVNSDDDRPPTTLTGEPLSDVVDPSDEAPGTQPSDSSSNRSVHSDTSTLEWDHEPFETFQHKVSQLVSSLLPASGPPIITRLQGGGYNRVIGVSFPDTTRELLLRPSPRSFLDTLDVH